MTLMGLVIISYVTYMWIDKSIKFKNTFIELQNTLAKNDSLHKYVDDQQTAYDKLAFINTSLDDSISGLQKDIRSKAAKIISLTIINAELKKQLSEGHGQSVINDSLLTYEAGDESHFLNYQLFVRANLRTKETTHRISIWSDPFGLKIPIYQDKLGRYHVSVEPSDTSIVITNIVPIISSDYVPEAKPEKSEATSPLSPLGLYLSTNFSTVYYGITYRPFMAGVSTDGKIFIGINATFIEMWKWMQIW